MGLLDDEFEDAPEVGRPRRARTLVLGEGGSEEGAHVVEGDVVDADADIAPVPSHPDEKGLPSGPTDAQRTEWRSRTPQERLSAGERWQEIVDAIGGDEEAQRGLRQHLDQRITDSAIGSSQGTTGTYRGGEAGLVGALQAVTLEHGDEITSALRGQPIEETRREMRQAEEQNPGAALTGRASGSLLLGAAIPGAGAGASGAARIGVAGVQGAGLGALTSHGASEGDTAAERFADAPTDALIGGLTGAGSASLGESVRGALDSAARAGQGADRARVASLGTGQSTTLGDRFWRQAAAQPGGVTPLAERVRRLGLVPAFGTAEDIAQRSAEASQRLGAEGELGRIYDLLDEEAPVPRQRLLDALLETATEIEGDPNSGRAADALVRRAADWEQRLPEELTYRQARDALAGLGDQVTWTDPSAGAPGVTARAGRQAYRGVRGALDDVAEQALASRAAREAGEATEGLRGGPASAQASQAARDAAAREVERFRGTRRDWQAAQFAEDAARDVLERQARNRGISLSDMQALQTGQGSLWQRALQMLANRGWRLREGTARATLAEALRTLGQTPRDTADPFIRALQRILPAEAVRERHGRSDEDESERPLSLDDEFERAAPAQ